MKSLKKLSASLVIASLGSLSSITHASDLVVGVPNWPSVAVTAEVIKIVLEDNLGLDVELQNGTNPVIFEAMDTGSIQVHPEVWLPNQSNLHNTYVKEKGTVKMNPNGVPSFQGMCVTKSTAQRTGIKKLSDLTDPDMAAKFDTDGDGLGEVWIGVPGWASTPIEKIRAKSYGYSETMSLKEMDETLALAEVDTAVAQDKNIVFFCYTPHHMFALHELVILEEPAFDASKWNVIQPTEDPEWLEKSDAAVAWDQAQLHIHYASKLDTSMPEVASVLSKIKFDTDDLSKMTFAVVVEKQDAATFAKSWVSENASAIETWLK